MNWVYKKLSRITGTGFYLAELDGLRFIAIFVVVVYHLSGMMPKHVILSYNTFDRLLHGAIELGGFGVSLFFCISGFILGFPFIKLISDKNYSFDLKKYYARRLHRLEPPYLINLIVCFILLCLHSHRFELWLLPHLGASIIYCHNVIYHRFSDVNYVTWSLEIEAQFYLCLPYFAKFLALLGTRKNTLVALYLCLAISVLALPLFNRWFSSPTLFTYAPLFLLGIIIADLFINSWDQALPSSRYGDLFLVLTGIIYFLNALALNPLSQYAVQLVGALVFLGGMTGTLLPKFCKLRLISVIGGMCYSIYLYHSQIISVLWPVLGKLGNRGGSFTSNLITLGPLALIVVLIVSSALYYFVEKPFMKPMLQK